MLNYTNLTDLEFEYLCADIMSKMLGVTLQWFAAGPDGGIDLTDDVVRHSIIVQVKYYIKTDAGGLVSSLRREIPKVDRLKPKEYYICCSKELSAKQKREIYLLFPEYMHTSTNIITLIEIDDFLSRPENADILQKHFKLWIESTNILTDIFTKDICIDCDALLWDIKRDKNLFVRTEAFDHAIECLQKCNVLMLLGNPGVGKTLTSEMLVLYYASRGYRVRYITDGENLSALKRALSQSKATKEVILLNDCFGQAYFDMKSTQESELLALIKFVKQNQQKLLIMNSRVSIYHEAMDRTPELSHSFGQKEYSAYRLDMNKLSNLEKAKIFYNHLFYSEFPEEYWQSIKSQRNYMKIIKHYNYNPRIIEFVCDPRQYQTVPALSYYNFIMECLQNPEQIWRNEYERRLAEPDRILLNTLFSLTNIMVPSSLVQQCYNHRIINTPGIDSSINHYSQSLHRLLEAMIKMVDVKGVRMLSVANPSINDFIRNHLENNQPEVDAILRSSFSIRQLKRFLGQEQYNCRLADLFGNHSILNYQFDDDQQKIGFITYYCTSHHVLDTVYQVYIASYLEKPQNVDVLEKTTIPFGIVLTELAKREFCEFYNLTELMRDIEWLTTILRMLHLDGAIRLVNAIDWLFNNELQNGFVEIVQSIIETTLERDYSEVSADDYDIDIETIIRMHSYEDYIDTDSMENDVDKEVRLAVCAEISESLAELPNDIIIDNRIISNLDIYVSESDELIKRELADYDIDEDAYREERYIDDEETEIDHIFNR